MEDMSLHSCWCDLDFGLAVSHGVSKSLTAIDEKARQSDQRVAAAALATHAAASTSEPKDVLLYRRLFVPGVLCHKGMDPNARFSRIVLSNTMLSDHSCPAYVDAVVDSLHCLARDLNGQHSW
jgi:hypothetical protein